MSSLEFMLLTPAPVSCTGDVGFVQQGETAKVMRTNRVEATIVS
jgi:hypothetical protein